MLTADSRWFCARMFEFFFRWPALKRCLHYCHVRNHIALLDRICSVFLKAHFIPQNPAGLASWDRTGSAFTSANCGLSCCHRAFRTDEGGRSFNSSLGLAWQGTRPWRCSVRINIGDISWRHQKAEKMHQDPYLYYHLQTSTAYELKPWMKLVWEKQHCKRKEF